MRSITITVSAALACLSNADSSADFGRSPARGEMLSLIARAPDVARGAFAFSAGWPQLESLHEFGPCRLFASGM